VDKEVDWADSLIKRAVKEPDGFIGWPGKDPHGTQVDGLNRLFGDNKQASVLTIDIAR